MIGSNLFIQSVTKVNAQLNQKHTTHPTLVILDSNAFSGNDTWSYNQPINKGYKYYLPKISCTRELYMKGTTYFWQTLKKQRFKPLWYSL